MTFYDTAIDFLFWAMVVWIIYLEYRISKLEDKLEEKNEV